MKHRLNTQRLSLRQIASRKRVAPSSVKSWIEHGCPRNADKTMSEAEVDKWLAAHREKAAEAKDLKQQKLEAEITRIKRDIESRDIELSRQRDEVHSKAECCKSLTAIVSEAMQPLMGLHTSVKAAFPELPQGVVDAIAAKVDAAVEQMREGLKC